MKAMLLDRLGTVEQNSTPLRMTELPEPVPARDEVLIGVKACGVCHTELDEIEGRTPPPHLPIVLGHQVVGRVVARGENVIDISLGQRVGVAWIYSACGQCCYCQTDRENLCPHFRATGCDHHGGYAEPIVAPAAFVVRIPEALSNVEAAPLLCAGAIGYRSLRLTNLVNGQRLGLTGFGASAHLVLKLVRRRFPDTEVFVFARSQHDRAFATNLGAAWAGDTTDVPPAPMDAIIDTTPAWTPIVAALGNLVPGGRLVINAIRKESSDQSALAGLDYARHLWLEKEIKSVANVTRRDVQEFVDLAAEIRLQPQIQTYSLGQVNQALVDLKFGGMPGAKVLQIADD